MVFRDRKEAGELLGKRLEKLGLENAVILGIPRGGVVVAAETARVLGAPLDVIVSVKLRAPYNPELGIGAMAEGDVVFLNQDIIEHLGVTENYVEEEKRRARLKIRTYVSMFRAGRPLLLEGRTAVVVDDGVATGATFIAALMAARKAGAGKTVAAVPVGPQGTGEVLKQYADEVVVLEEPYFFTAVGEFYRDFSQVSDEEVVNILHYRGT